MCECYRRTGRMLTPLMPHALNDGYFDKFGNRNTDAIALHEDTITRQIEFPSGPVSLQKVSVQKLFAARYSGLLSDVFRYSENRSALSYRPLDTKLQY